ncbi:MAG: cytochrome c3 family protein [Desulfuromonadales bacterium]|nr:cytochrome c3 family protein [Desulfuromonadales bacterium]
MKHKAVIALSLLAILTLGGGVGYAAMGDLVFERKAEVEGSAAFPPAIFSHWVHRVRYRCYACHPAIFEMEAGANDVTMDAIKKGEFCGTCHNGRVAFSVEFQNCARCHRKSE